MILKRHEIKNFIEHDSNWTIKFSDKIFEILENFENVKEIDVIRK